MNNYCKINFEKRHKIFQKTKIKRVRERERESTREKIIVHFDDDRLEDI